MALQSGPRRRPLIFRLNRNEACETPSHYVFVDASCRQPTKPDGSIDRLAPWELEFAYAQYARYRRGKFGAWQDYTCKTGAELWEWIRSRGQPKQPVWVFAYNWHFLAQALGLWEEFDSERFKLGLPKRLYYDENGNTKEIKEWRGMCAIDEKPFIVFAVGSKGTVKIVDVRNYYDCPFAEIASSCGTRKACSPQANDDGPSRYAKITGRVETIGACISRTIETWKEGDRGNWQPTAAKLAWSNFRHEFMSEEMRTIDNTKMDRVFQRSGFFGGEFSYWYRGRYDGRVYKVDVNSLFPSVMATGNFPIGVKFIAEAGSPLAATCPPNPADCMAELLVYGCGDLPTRNTNGGVEYPTGIFPTVLCGSELDYAVRNNRVKTWHRWTQFKMAPIFDRFVAYWWAQRQQCRATHNDAGAMLAKLIMNSLYGRFAQRTPKWKLDFSQEAPIRWGYFLAMDPEKRKLEKQRSIAGVRQRLVGQEEKEDTFPAVSAFITSAARVYMRNVRHLLGPRSVLLQQADSLTMTEEAYNKLCGTVYMGEGLGQIRLEAIAEWIEVLGANQYCTNHGWVMAGVPTDRTRADGGNRWRVRRPFTTADVIAKGVSGNVPIHETTHIVNASPTVRQFEKTGWAFL